MNTRLRQFLGSIRADGTVTVALAGITAAYLLSFPHYLGDSDEGLILYEAKRLLAGEVYFRDIFDIVPPGTQYLAAGAFSLFGIGITTARALDAIVQALITVATYGCCRAAGVRRPLAVIAAVLQPLLFWPIWPFVSPHWLSGLLWLALLAVLCRRPWARRPSRAAAVGVILGLMALVQQQRAAIASVGIVLFFAADAVVARRFRERGAWRVTMQRIFCCAAAGLVVALPPFLALAARGGVQPMVRALILHPLLHYHTAIRPPRWGTMFGYDSFGAGTLPAFVRWLPTALIGVALIGMWCWIRRRRVEQVRVALALSAVGAVAVASSLYFPDLVHLAFFGPVCAAAAAVLVEWSARATESRWPAAVIGVGALALSVAVGVFGWRAVQLRSAAWRHVAASAPTPFGAIDFLDSRVATLVDGINRLAASDPQRRLFVYPFGAALYLMTDTRNPTSLQIIYPGYSFDSQIAEAQAVVEQQQSPLIVFVPWTPPGDSFPDLLARHYVRVPGQQALWEAAPHENR